MAPSTPRPTSSRIVGDVLQRRDTARGDDRPVRASAHVAQQLEVRALEHAVLVDVGDDVARAPLAVEPLQRLPEVAALLGPAPRRQAWCPGRPDPTATRSPCSAMARAVHSGSSRAAVPRFTRRQPVASAASSDAASRMPPLSSTLMSSLPTMPASRSRFDPRPKAASRSTRCSHSAPCSCQASAACQGSPNCPPVPATPCTSWTAWPSCDVDGGQQLEPGGCGGQGRGGGHDGSWSGADDGAYGEGLTGTAPSSRAGSARRRRTSRGGTGSPTTGRSRPRRRSVHRARPR